MYLYLGQDTVVQTKDIISILDLDNTSISRITRAYLKQAQQSGQVIEVSQELPKSFVVCGHKKKGYQVYLSQISPSTLRKRASFVQELANL
ncbi:extracellular matrix/biofilm biosynthesis regulator RemA family protein [Oscillospiraceae bacterium MB08-C2-2]|nr:extracellular matrix/biofilm biosynthesis regulator RemA family protein [Oscillospiraceae bacterium MB08-C2-2]